MSLRIGSASAAAVMTVLGVFAAPGLAKADSTIKEPGAHPKYHVEAEPHLLFGYDNYFLGGFGVGARFSIPVVENGFIKTINNSIAIGLGLDISHYGGCYYRNNFCGQNVFSLPVVMQWNFYVAEHWSVFGEPGVAIRHRSFDGCPPGTDCVTPASTIFLPFTFFAGGRYHFSESVALTMRLGIDNSSSSYGSIGVSFFP